VRFAPLLIVLSLVACSGDDGSQHAAGTSTTRSTSTSSTTEASSSTSSCGASSPTPTAADGTSAAVVGTIGDVQLAIVDHGASVDVVSLFRGCDLEPVTLDGATAALPIGGTVTHGDGMRCEDDRVIVLSATSDDGETYQAKQTTYRIDGTSLVATATKAATIEAQREPDALRPYYELDC
jgi:hypothetical protein